MLFDWRQPAWPFYLSNCDQLDEMASVFERMAQAGVQALSLRPSGLLFQGRDSIQKLALARGMARAARCRCAAGLGRHWFLACYFPMDSTDALSRQARQIAINAGDDGSIVVGKISVVSVGV
jgi:hypothetical protein